MYEYRAACVRVVDGDSIVLDVDLGFNAHLTKMAIRLIGINAPELRTPEGKAAKAFAANLCPPGTLVTLESHKDRADKYGGRWLGEVVLADLTVLNELLVAAGHAVRWDGKGVKP